MVARRMEPARPIALLAMLPAVAGGCAAHPVIAARRAEPVIALRHHSANELATRQQLERLLSQYDVSPWSFTDRYALRKPSQPCTDNSPNAGAIAVTAVKPQGR